MEQPAIRFESSRVFPASVADAWRVLADTDRVNRAIGLPAVDFGPPAQAGAPPLREARARALRGTVSVRWREYPFEWVRERRYAVRREFASGPLAVFEGGVELEPAGEGVRVHVFADLTPAGVAGRLVAARLGPRNVERVLAYCACALEGEDGGVPELPEVGGERPHVEEGRLAGLLARLRSEPVDDRLVERLGALVREAPDAEVTRVRPYAVADAWGAERRDVLRLFLHATRVGLFTLRWELMCPSCRVPKAERETLRELPDRFHCETCGIDYETELERRVELRFSVHASVRRAHDAVYCVGGPWRAPHVLVQQYLRPGERRAVETDAAGALTLRAPGAPGRLALVPDGAAGGELALAYDGDWRAANGAGPAALAFRPGPLRLELENGTDAPLLAQLELEEWDAGAATAAHVTALQEFRDLFGSEVLAPGAEVGVSSIALLFTDLKGSTSMYEGTGDAPAYGRVHRHFAYVQEHVAAHEGAVVKTIGDAVMAAFACVDDAMAAALAIQRGIGAWCAGAGIEPPLVLKIGVHHGPALAVTANDRLDYFGRTVNVAARVAGAARGADVVVVRELLEAEAVRRVLEGAEVRIEQLRAELRGVEGERELARIVVGA